MLQIITIHTPVVTTPYTTNNPESTTTRFRVFTGCGSNAAAANTADPVPMDLEMSRVRFRVSVGCHPAMLVL